VDVDGAARLLGVNPFALRGRLGRTPYALSCLGLFAAQYLVAFAVITTP
jgi:hypothetical protein